MHQVAAEFEQSWEEEQRGRGRYKPRHAVRTARLVTVGHPIHIC
jgi:hypothetical protein